MNDILTAVFGRLRMRLHSGAAMMLHSDQEADDVLQDAFERLWMQRSSFKGERHVEGAAVTTVEKYMHRRAAPAPARPEAELSDTIAATDGDNSAERQQLLDAVGERLPMEYALRVFPLLYVDGYSVDDLRKAAGAPADARNRLSGRQWLSKAP